MGWKDWSYWLKGGIIGILISLVFLASSYFTGQIKIVSYINQCLIPPCSSDLHFYLFSNSNFLFVREFLISMIVILICCFIIGSFIGWIVGKIKSR